MRFTSSSALLASKRIDSSKDVMAFSKAVKYKKAIEIEYEALLSNKTWELVDKLTHQQVLTKKLIYK